MILICGEALVDLTPATCGGEAGYVPRAGGSPFNVAVGLARLGAPTRYVGGLSSDPFGRLLSRHLEASGVDMSLVARSEAPSPVAFVMLDAGTPEYVFHLGGTAMHDVPPIPDPLPEDVRALHVGSIALVLEPAATATQDLLRRAHRDRFTSLDPNIRERFIKDRGAYLARLDEWLGMTDLVKVSDEDLRWLHPEDDPLDVASRWLARGPAVVIVTRGGRGAVATTHEHRLDVPGTPVDVVDTVGAGDAFMSGLLCWLSDHNALDRNAVAALAPDELTDLLRFAGRVAARTCERPGADPPTRAQLGDT